MSGKFLWVTETETKSNFMKRSYLVKLVVESVLGELAVLKELLCS